MYRLVVKPSARKRSRAVGEWVNREGPRRVFGTKALAREWARACAGPDTHLWVQDAPPWDEGADGYLVGGRRARPGPTAGTTQTALSAGEDDAEND